MRLTDIAIRALPLPERGQKIHWEDLPGFGVRVSQGGTKTFVLMHGANRQLSTIGRCGIIDLRDARARAKEMLAERTLRKTRPRSISYETAQTEFLDEKRNGRRSRTVANLEHRLKRHFPFRGRLGDITHHDIASRLSKLTTNSEHDHALSVARTFFNWAYNRRYIDDNPTRGLFLRGSPSRSRVLSDVELKRVWMAAENMGGSFGAIVKLATLTGQRRGEIAALDHAWIGEGTITLPAAITKNKREHTFPLAPAARAMLPREGKGPVFPARGKPDQPFNGWSKGKTELDKISGVSGWTLHDLRRTVASNLAALGVQLPVIERLLNHVSGSFGGIVSVYQRHSFMPEMRAAVEKWDARLLELLAC